MNITVTSGTGVGPTELAAFDNALINAGVANFNLIYLSSVLPPGSDVAVYDKPVKPAGGWGDKLYVVMAQQRTSQRNQEVWAGIGWVQDPKTKKGLLAEHQGFNEDEIRADIQNSLQGFAENRNAQFGPVNMHVAGKKCISLPVCALVIAVFESGTWEALDKGAFGRLKPHFKQ